MNRDALVTDDHDSKFDFHAADNALRDGRLEPALAFRANKTEAQMKKLTLLAAAAAIVAGTAGSALAQSQGSDNNRNGYRAESQRDQGNTNKAWSEWHEKFYHDAGMIAHR